MYSATGRVRSVSQPYGGYLPLKDFTLDVLAQDDDTMLDLTVETVSAPDVGMAVDYLVRLRNGELPESAFAISLQGAHLLGESVLASAMGHVATLEPGVVDDHAVRVACGLVAYDAAYRAGPEMYRDQNAVPNEDTTRHILTMVERAAAFFEQVGPVTANGFEFKPAAFEGLIAAADGDVLTTTGLWDLKVSKYRPKSTHTLQLLVYFLMGLHSDDSRFDTVTTLGIFNPRRHESYTIEVDRIDQAVLDAVSRDVIGYVN